MGIGLEEDTRHHTYCILLFVSFNPVFVATSTNFATKLELLSSLHARRAEWQLIQSMIGFPALPTLLRVCWPILLLSHCFGISSPKHLDTELHHNLRIRKTCIHKFICTYIHKYLTTHYID